MADNLTTPVADGSVLGTKDIGGVHLPKNVIVDQAGADAIGLVASDPAANSVLGRLKAIFDRLGDALSVTIASLPLPTGAATSAKQDDILTALAGPFPVTGDFYPETQPVSAASLPLPAGAATATKQDAATAAIEALAPQGPAFAITPHASDPLEREIGAISIVTGGDITYRYPGEGGDRTITLPAGFFPLRASHIRDSSTASGLTGF
ncbi:hypothetical protein G432_05180 [Sphingomonas sp. MM-1]|uniref:spike base protein, RCAP_Rcc01079 family n=1 Tax=Sphingomonas sp. MM-1 TaxID=745310 RepID=UPI0002C0826F|nr:hypothetical protein [Sphingomonas sp. MM-1]AGH48763.1 hypothetical protein G432_05180 [Sphingomonas sp. MM-1]